MAKKGDLATLQLLLEEAAQPLWPSRLLQAALRGRQLASMQLVLARCGMPAHSSQLLLGAVNSGELALVQLLLERELVPGAAELAAAIRLPSPAILQTLLAACDGPVTVAPLERQTIRLHSPVADAPYTCPVLVTLQERVRQVSRLQWQGTALELYALCKHVYANLAIA